jgi:hypothetical protein
MRIGVNVEYPSANLELNEAQGRATKEMQQIWMIPNFISC